MKRTIKNLRKDLNEEDLFRQQDEFLQASKKPDFKPTVSKFYKSEQVIKDQEKKPSYNDPTSVFMPLNIIEHDTSNVSVNEIEKTITESVELNDQALKFNLATLSTTQQGTTGKKKSLFAQYMESKKQKMSNSVSSTHRTTSSVYSTFENSNQTQLRMANLVDGSGLFNDKELARKEVESISKENDAKLKELGKDEKQKLFEQFNLSNLDPKMVEFIKSRSNKRKELLNEQTTSLKMEEDLMPFDDLRKQKDHKSHEDSVLIDEEEIRKNKWLNMDKVENAKMEWMRPLLENEKKKPKQHTVVEGKAARFNFEGDLVLEQDLDYRLGLHHHSEQDSAAGYTLNELIALTQSKFIPQRILALNTLANVFRRMHRGYFDICFDKSLTIELIEQTEIFLLLRRLLDDSNVSLKLVTIKCIHSLLCNTIYDEFCLDRLFCSMELGVEVPKLCCNTELLNEDDYKDEQLCKLDVVSCLLRTDLLPRLRYLLDQLLLKQSVVELDLVVVDNILDILIRICRHSIKACTQLATTPYLIECLINNLIVSNSCVLNWKALKIIRILFTTDKKFISQIKNEFPVLMITIRNYLITNPLNENSKESYSAIIEVLRVWRVLLIFQNELTDTIEQFIELASNIRNCLNIQILVNNSFDLHYVSNLLHCLAYAIQRSPSLEVFFTPLVQELTFSWFRQILNQNELPKLDGCLALSSALLYLNCSTTNKKQLLDYVLKPILDSDRLLEKLTDQLLDFSSILNFREYHNSIYRDSKALPSYGSIYFGGQTIKLNQLLSENSVIFLAGPLVGLAAKHKLTDCLEQFIYNDKIRKYLNSVVQQTNKSSNWTLFELIEFNLVSQLILWEQSVLRNNEYADHAFAILSSVADLQLKQSLCDCVFDVREYKSAYDRLRAANSAITDAHSQLQDQLIKSSISFFNEIKKVYLKFSSFEDRYWLFEPLVKLYKLQLDVNCLLSENELVDHLTSCLNFFVLIYNFKASYLWSLVEPRIFFVYLSSVFLFRNALFLNEQLLKPLKYFLVDLIAKHPINFDCYEEKVPKPFGAIADHFNALCNNFKTDSYGDPLFSNYLLCFITQSSDRIFRKKLLDEHTACLNYFILNKEQLLIELKCLCSPIENDLSIVESWVRVLMGKEILEKRNPLIYHIACTHVSKSLFDERYHENRLQNAHLSTKLINSLKQSTNSQLKEHLHILN